MNEDATLFLRESNAIEGVYDEESLVQASQAWDYLLESYELSLTTLLGAHRILMHDKLFPSQIGCLRKCDVRVGGYVAVGYQKLPNRIAEWINNVNGSMKFPRSEEDNELLGISQHVEFEKIHPFVDGNGRMGRMLLNWWRLMVGLPILVIYESTKLEYYKWFK